MIVQTKVLLFAVPMLLALGSGVGVAYHDGVMADDVKTVSKENVGEEVAFKGEVVGRNEHCREGDRKLGKDVACFAVKDLEEHAFVMVTTDETPPQEGDVVVVRGTLRYYFAVEGGSGSTSWKGGCWDAGAYGSGCWDGGSTSWSWDGFEFAWIDAASVTEPWFFK